MGVLVLAHSTGRAATGLPLWIVLAVTAAATAGAAAAERSTPLERGWPADGARGRRDRPRAGSWAGRVAPLVGGVLLAAPLLAAELGPVDRAANPAATWVFLLGWAGFVPSTLLLGPWWATVDPLRPIGVALHRALNRHGGGLTAEIGPHVGGWIAAGTLLMLAWVRIVSGVASAPATVAVTVLAFAFVQVCGGMWFGASWHDRADPLVLLSRALGSLAPLGRRWAGAVPVEAASVLWAALGATLFDAGVAVFVHEDMTIGHSTGWVLVVGTCGMLVAVAIPALLSWGVRAVAGPAVRRAGRRALAAGVGGFATLHAISLLALDGRLWFVSRLDGFGDASAPFTYVEGRIGEGLGTPVALLQATLVLAVALAVTRLVVPVAPAGWRRVAVTVLVVVLSAGAVVVFVGS